MLIPPVSYTEFLRIIKNSEFLATDGATNQYEAYLMGKPCILLRNHTEQIEGLGKNVILYKSDAKTLKTFVSNYKKYKSVTVTPKKSPSKIIVDSLMEPGIV